MDSPLHVSSLLRTPFFSVGTELRKRPYESVCMASGPDGHESFFPVEWLRRHAYNAAPRTPPKRLWTASQIQKDPPSVEYQEVMKDDQALLVWLKHIAATGLCFVNNAPSTPEATEALAERMCVKRDPFYVNVYWLDWPR